MTTILGPEFTAAFTGRPTGISEEDMQIWRAWFPKIRGRVKKMFFNVRLGKGRKAPSTGIETLDKMWIDITQKRADVVIQVENEVWIVELRFNAALSAIGRLLGYRTLWMEDPALKGKVTPVLVTNVEDADVRRVAEETGIIYEVIEEPIVVLPTGIE